MPAWHEAKWVDDPDAGPQKKRRFRLAWAWLLLIPAALMVLSVAQSNNYWQYDDITVSTLQCQEPVGEEPQGEEPQGEETTGEETTGEEPQGEEPTWAELELAGCAPAAIGAEVELTDAGRHPDADVESDGTTWTFEQVPTAFTTLALDVQLPEAAGRVFLVNPETSPPTVLNELSASDVADTMFAGPVGAVKSTSIQVVVTPPQ